MKDFVVCFDERDSKSWFNVPFTTARGETKPLIVASCVPGTLQGQSMFAFFADRFIIKKKPVFWVMATLQRTNA